MATAASQIASETTKQAALAQPHPAGIPGALEVAMGLLRRRRGDGCTGVALLSPRRTVTARMGTIWWFSGVPHNRRIVASASAPLSSSGAIRFFPRNAAQFTVSVAEHKDRVCIVSVVGLAFERHAVAIDQTLTCFAARRRAESTTDGEILLVKDAGASLLCGTLCSGLHALRHDSLASLFPFSEPPRLTRLSSSKCRLRADFAP